MRTTPRAFTPLLLAALVAGCMHDADVIQPTTLDGTWIAVAANDQPLPAVVHDVTYPDIGERIQVFATVDTIVVTDGRYRQRALTYANSNGTLVGTQVIGDHGLVARDGAVVHFASDFYDGRTFDATLSGDELFVVQDLAAQGSTAQFTMRRVSP